MIATIVRDLKVAESASRRGFGPPPSHHCHNVAELEGRVTCSRIHGTFAGPVDYTAGACNENIVHRWTRLLHTT